jgi:TRAP transporter TAXI family solute receptor
MKKKKTLKLLLISFTLLMLTLSFQGSASTAEVTQLSMGTAAVGGFFYDVGAPVAQCINKALPEVNVTAEFTEGSTENLRLIGQKKMELGVISPMIGHFARNGLAMFKDKPIDFRVVVRLLPNGNIWVTLKSNKDIKTIRDIKGHKVGVGTGGIGVMARMQLAAHGIDDKTDVKPFYPPTGELATLLKDGKVDVSFLTDGLAKMVTATHEIRIISWQEEDRKKYIKDNP